MRRSDRKAKRRQPWSGMRFDSDVEPFLILPELARDNKAAEGPVFELGFVARTLPRPFV
jgi:hypothetical protein